MTKHLKIKILLFGVSLFLINCQKDDDFKNTAPIEVMVKKPISISTIQKEQIIANKQVWSSIEKLKTELNEFNASQQNRTVYSDSTGLEIDTDFATYIEFENGYHSFTFLVTNTPDDGGLQNVLISLQPDNSYKEFLVHYDITTDEMQQLYNGQEVNLINRYTMTEIDSSFTEDIFSRVVFEDECTRLDFEPNTCSSGAHEYGDNNCTYIGDDNPNTHTALPGGLYTTTLKPCDLTGGVTPGSSTPSNQGPYGSVGDGGNTSSPTACGGSRKCVPVDTDSVMTEDQEDAATLISDCNVLNDLSASPDFPTRMQDLIANVTGNTEIAYYGETNSNDVTSFPNDSNHRFESLPNAGAVVDFPLPVSVINAIIQNHFNDGTGSYSIFSPQDLASFFSLYSNSTGSSLIQDLDNFVAIVLTPGETASPDDDTVYALTISSTIDFTAVADLYAISPELIKVEYENRKISPNISNNLNEERLPNF
ncbi:hypothetical protein ACW5R3_13470 [Bizionia sp. KMM 8389]